MYFDNFWVYKIFIVVEYSGVKIILLFFKLGEMNQIVEFLKKFLLGKVYLRGFSQKMKVKKNC